MKKIQILGGNPLYGEVELQGSKNAVLPMLAATVLNAGISVIHNCPKIEDVYCMIHILEAIGCRVEWENHTLRIDTKRVHTFQIPKETACKMRSSIIFLGSLLGRLGQAEMSYPGGCVIGCRPIDLHLKAFSEMNVEIREQEGNLLAKTDRLIGKQILLPFPSVGATENIILGAVLAEGNTLIVNAAMEPEIAELCHFLNQMGCEIRGIGTSKIEITGVKRLHDVEYTVIPDRIVAGTYLLACVGTKGSVRIKNAPYGHMDSTLKLVREMGAYAVWCGNTLSVTMKNRACPLEKVETEVYPGFPTDLQSQLMTVLTTAQGKSCLREKIFEERFKTVEALVNMGAEIEFCQNEACIVGVNALKGTTVEAKELRGGAALVIAGLMAEGRTEVTNAHFIERGYEDIVGDLQKLGARIQAV